MREGSGKQNVWKILFVSVMVFLALIGIGGEVTTYKQGGRHGSTHFEKERWARTIQQLTTRGVAQSKVFDWVFT